ncbi:MAG: acylphosphatase [Pirellulaceae bacterium]
MLRLRAIFVGHVQGVGFRYSTRRIAMGFAVTGWVRNLSDGSVELMAEGEKLELQRFLDQIKQEMGSQIRDIKQEWLDASHEFSTFGIGYE